MTNTFRTFVIPAALSGKAVSITDALGYPHKGMFVSRMSEGAPPPLGQPDNRTLIASISTGIVDSASPLLGTPAALWAAVQQAGTPGTVTLADCTALVAALDLTDAEPHGRMDFIRSEVADATNAPTWVQPTGAHDAYARDAAVTHAGKGWRNLMAANVFAPGVTGWRELWGSSGVPNEWPDWVQPLGTQDAYPIGAKVTHAGHRWISAVAANVWPPGTGALWTQQAAQGGGTPAAVPVWKPYDGTPASLYKVGDKVTFEGKVYTSKIANNSWAPTAYAAGWQVS